MKKIKFKEINVDKPVGGCVYVFGIWAGGVYACHRQLMWASGTQTKICNHNVYENTGGSRYIVIRTYDGNIKVLLKDIAREHWRNQHIVRAGETTGIENKTLYKIANKMASLSEQYPNHKMLDVHRPAKPEENRCQSQARKSKKLKRS